MTQNVKIPMTLFNETVNLLETLTFIDFRDEGFHDIINSILWQYQHKKESMALRETYGKIAYAKDEDERFDARMKYLEERRKLKGGN